MTDDSDFKNKVRARMRHTGENYTTARAALLRREPPPTPPLDGLAEDERDSFRKTVRAHFRGPKLASLPLKRRALVVILLMLLQKFERGRTYTEAEVNALLYEAWEDFAHLRRELVDYGYLQREGGRYWVAEVVPERGAQLRQEVPVDEAGYVARLFHKG